MRRRALLAAALLAGCAADPSAPDKPTAVAEPGQLVPWRTVHGGFLTPLLPALGRAAPLVTGMYVRWASSAAIALHGQDMLVTELAQQRLWRVDLMSNAVTAVAAAPVGPGTAVALGPDLSAWVLDPASRQVLRFARDGRLMQSLGVGLSSPLPVALLLADGGATLLVADGMGAQWAEARGAGNFVRSVMPQQDGGVRVSGIAGLALAPEGLFVLDRLAGVVHRCTREGRVLETLGQGDLMQPVALASDRFGRVWVHDQQDDSVKRLRRGAPPWRWSAAELGVQRIGGIAIDGHLLAVSDRQGGAVVVHSFAHDRSP